MFTHIFCSGFNTALQSTDTQKVSEEFINSRIASIPSISVDVKEIFNENTRDVLTASNEIVQNFVPTVQNIFSAVGNANIKLLSEFGNAGNILGGNILNLGMATTDVTGKILIRCSTRFLLEKINLLTSLDISNFLLLDFCPFLFLIFNCFISACSFYIYPLVLIIWEGTYSCQTSLQHVIFSFTVFNLEKMHDTQIYDYYLVRSYSSIILLLFL